MKLLLASAAFMVISAASGAVAEKLIFPDGLNPDEFEAQKPCSGRSSETWCLNDYQPDGGCEWTGRRCMDKQPDDDRMPCEGRKSRTWCTNDFQPRSGDCEWRGNNRNGSCRTVEEDTPSPTPAPDDRMRCSGRTTKTWCTNNFQPRSGDCRWNNNRGRCVERRNGGGGGGNDCDGVATSRKLDCRDYCKSRNPRSWSYKWKYDSDKYTCTCKDGKTCTSWRYEEGEDISADYFASNSADFEEE